MFYVVAAIWVAFELYYLFMGSIGHPKYCQNDLPLRMLLGPFGLLW